MWPCGWDSLFHFFDIKFCKSRVYIAYVMKKGLPVRRTPQTQAQTLQTYWNPEGRGKSEAPPGTPSGTPWKPPCAAPFGRSRASGRAAAPSKEKGRPGRWGQGPGARPRWEVSRRPPGHQASLGRRPAHTKSPRGRSGEPKAKSPRGMCVGSIILRARSRFQLP
jgi:hypothetical protein